MIKPYSQEIIAIEAASTHVQMLQKQLNEISYQAFLQKQKINIGTINALLQNAQTNNNLFTFTLRGDDFTLRIKSKQLKLNLRENSNGSYTIACNPSNELCRKIYHRKHKK